MKIEYIAKGTSDCPIIRISQTTPEECKILEDLFYKLSKNELKQAEVHKLSVCTSSDECQLTAQVGERNLGIIQKNRNIFAWKLKDTLWDNIAGLVEPFCQGSCGFQWLDDTSGISVLLSPEGNW